MLDVLRQRRFGPFFWTQLLGALNDNVFRNLSALFMAAAAVLAIGLLRAGATIHGECGVPRRSRADGGAILTPRAAAAL